MNRKRLLNRFIKYVKVHTTACDGVDCYLSLPKIPSVVIRAGDS